MHPVCGAKRHAVTTVCLIGVLSLTLYAFWGALRAPFHYDDSLFLESPQVASAGGLLHLLRPVQTRQLAYLSFYLNYRLGGTDPKGYHLVNLLLHLTNTLLLYLFVRLLVAQSQPDLPQADLLRLLPIAAAGIFALHPVQSEAVNYVYQRCTLLAAFFSLLSLCFFLRSERASSSWLNRLAALAFWLLATAGKESAWILPLVFVSYSWTHAGDRNAFRACLRRSGRFLATTAVVMASGIAWICHSLQQSADRTIGLLHPSDSLHYLANEIQVFATYLRLLVWPAGLSVDHDFRPHALWSPYGLYCLLLVLGLPVLAVRIRTSRPHAAFLCLSFLILLAPTSSIFPSADLMFEHRLYLPMIAGSVLIALVVITVCAGLVRRKGIRSMVCLGVLGAQLAAYAALSRERTYIWGDNVRLWTDAVAKAPEKARAHYNLGVACLNTNREKAREEFLQVVRLAPHHAAALYDLGWMEQSLGRYGAARNYYAASLRADVANWRAHQNLGNLDALQGRFSEAMSEYEETIRLRPDYWPTYQSLAVLQIQAGRPEDALSTLQKLKTLRPDLLEAAFLSAHALSESKRWAEAEAELAALEARDTSGAYGPRIEQLRRDMKLEREKP